MKADPHRLLQAAREHVLAHTLGLYWINTDREQIIIGEFVSDSGNFTTARRLNLGSDLIEPQIGSVHGIGCYHEVFRTV